MNASILPRLKLLGVASVLALAATAAMAQSEEIAPAPAKHGTAAKTGDAKAGEKTGEKSGAAAKKPARPAGPAGYASEAEARAHCKGEVVWVDKDHFYHYPGSREYGRKPGAFTCEKS
jgi:hypothetical protein